MKLDLSLDIKKNDALKFRSKSDTINRITVTKS